MCLISILATANHETISTLDALPHLVGMVMVMVVLAVLWGVCAFTAKMIRIAVEEGQILYSISQSTLPEKS